MHLLVVFFVSLKANIIVVSSASAIFPQCSEVILNILVIQSCELVEFHGGSLGLFKYGVSENGKIGCAGYSGDVEDAAIKYAQMWSVLAVGFGLSLMILMGLLHQRIYSFPFCSDLILLNIISIGVQLSMAHVYIVWKNDVCETYGCEWGRGSVYNAGAQLMYLVASSIAVYHYYHNSNSIAFEQQQQQHHQIQGTPKRVPSPFFARKTPSSDGSSKKDDDEREPRHDKGGPPNLPDLVDEKKEEHSIPNNRIRNNMRERRTNAIVS